MLFLPILFLSAITKAAKIPFKNNYGSIRAENGSINYTIVAAADIYSKNVQSRFDAPLVKGLVKKGSYLDVVDAFFPSTKEKDDMDGNIFYEITSDNIVTISSLPSPRPCLKGLIQNHLPTINAIKAFRDENVKENFRSGRVQSYINKQGRVITWAGAFKHIFTTATNAAASYIDSPYMYRQVFNTTAKKFYQGMKMQALYVKADPRSKSLRQPFFTLCKKDTPMTVVYNNHTTASGFLEPADFVNFTEDNGMILAYVPEKQMFYVAYVRGLNMNAFENISEISSSADDFKLENHPIFFESFFKKEACPQFRL